MTVINSKLTMRAPAVEALIIQGFSIVLVLAFTYGASAFADYDVTLAFAAVLQGLLASSIARWRRMATWWLLIQLFFPVVLLLVLSLHLPPTLFLVAFIFLLGLYWTTFRTQVPYYPSNHETWDAVAGLLPQHPVKFIDIGSGLGGLILNLSKRRPDSDFMGIELAPLPWAISYVRAWMLRRDCRFIRGDYNQLDFANFDVIFAYLSPAAMPALWEKARAEMRPGTLLLSYEFHISARNPDVIIKSPNRGAELYCWKME